MKKIFATLLVLVFSFPIAVNAQHIDLTADQKEALSDRIKQKIESFLDNLSYVANADREVQSEAIKSTLALFIGRGGPYTIYDMYDNPTNYNGVTMQTASLRKNKYGKPTYNRPILMTKYLNNLRGLPYDRVEITQVGAIRVDNISKVGEGRYQAIAHFCQDFSGYRDGQMIYHDRTMKKVKVFVEYIDDGGSGAWQAYLGDMRVESISRN